MHYETCAEAGGATAKRGPVAHAQRLSDFFRSDTDERDPNKTRDAAARAATVRPRIAVARAPQLRAATRRRSRAPASTMDHAALNILQNGAMQKQAELGFATSISGGAIKSDAADDRHGRADSLPPAPPVVDAAESVGARGRLLVVSSYKSSWRG